MLQGCFKVSDSGFRAPDLRMDDAEAGRSHRMLIEPADDAANKVLALM